MRVDYAASIRDVPMPQRIKWLPVSPKGYPTPWFVCWLLEDLDGEPHPVHPDTPGAKPDFRVVAPGRIALAYKANRCWICGQPLGSHRVYNIGPMCVVNRVTSEPPSHRECAEYAAKACPFLTNPREKRNEKNLMEGATAAGMMIARNPGVVALYETKHAKPFRAGDGWLFRLGPPDRLDWYAEGRVATHHEVMESIRTGLPLLMAEAEKDGPEAMRELEKMYGEAMPFLPAA